MPREVDGLTFDLLEQTLLQHDVVSPDLRDRLELDEGLRAWTYVHAGRQRDGVAAIHIDLIHEPADVGDECHRIVWPRRQHFQSQLLAARVTHLARTRHERHQPGISSPHQVEAELNAGQDLITCQVEVDVIHRAFEQWEPIDTAPADYQL